MSSGLKSSIGIPPIEIKLNFDFFLNRKNMGTKEPPYFAVEQHFLFGGILGVIKQG